MTKILYIVSLLALGTSILFGMLADDNRTQAQRMASRNQALMEELKPLEAEVAMIRKVEPAPLKFADDALSEFFSRTVEAGEVLGAGVRVEPRGSMGSRDMIFNEFKQGVRVCQVSLSAGLEAEGAAAILAMFEEELADLPVTVRKASAKLMGDSVSLSMDIDVFGR
ncbi:MAG: hypothetical protein QM765_37680 [Myxococcales bacterium]